MILALTLTTACGGDDDGGAAEPATQPSVNASQAIPTPGTTAATRPPATSSGPITPSSVPTQSDEQKKQLSKLAKCLKKYGIDIPSDSSTSYTPPPDFDEELAQKALKDCLPAVRN